MIDRFRFLPVLHLAGAGLCLSLICPPALAADKAEKPAVPPGEEVVCKKIEQIGSLVKRKKVCLTRDQWTRSADKHEQYARDLADTLRTKPAGN